ncbi:3-hydroxyacyl-CoA dehydrogenase NAD-binding domain-containing protein [Acidipila rosea]|uniref:3-hydroxybutyryl-CoA dehydrogenase n=1 Tax=Acidipila rosea TaxID=768535 RepID=A0A4R1L8W0_9BACT|nr:3-hydroxyacyl-CoA dehydrogenase NAD-binding domain-containing protein [Acidipila rosea]MBW4026758.1 3-hydroxyacyl-CoA dehydrogenase [Acidobacteriota bacterium]MBW4044935.1 3-hydroxyacyl-CoA dehydrogenase [Acidobacteriota bacterium]TCK73640.1 3-hydroxybutyryl-CoA dehydrogenase [Acidipila rosea]
MIDSKVISSKVVAIIGAGPLGRELALLCARAGYATVLEDLMPSNLRRAVEYVASTDAASASLTYASTIEGAVRDADIILDTVPDELESKLEIFSLLDRMAPPKAIFCTPTRALSIADLASCTYRPERCVGLKLPVSLENGQQIEITTTPRTAPDVVTAVKELCQAVGLVPMTAVDPLELSKI